MLARRHDPGAARTFHYCTFASLAIANERLKRNRAGQLVLQLKSAYRDGTTHIVMSPLQFMQRLAALYTRSCCSTRAGAHELGAFAQAGL